MHNTVYKLSLIFMAFVLFSRCELVSPEDGSDLRTLTAEEKQLIQSQNQFGLKLFREINNTTPDNNVFISPLSVSMALGMTLNGAVGETRTAMEQALELKGLTVEQINASYQSLIELLSDLDPKVKFEIANSIWYRLGFEVLPDFISVNGEYFDAEVQEEDFNSPKAVERINGWVDEKTHGKIEKIIDGIASDVMMYLINAIYFNGTWQFEFDENNTRDDMFATHDGSQVEVRMMKQQADLQYHKSDELQVIDLPYGDGQYSMTVLLPAQGKSINELVASLDSERWDQLTGQLQKTNVLLHLPRFKLELKYEQEMKEALNTLGMGIAFSPAADFSGISIKDRLLISKIIHKTFVEVDEEGTEAAAVTAVEVSLTSAGPQQPQVTVMRVDRPFVFAIREHHSGTVLFVGKVLNPTA